MALREQAPESLIGPICLVSHLDIRVNLRVIIGVMVRVRLAVNQSAQLMGGFAVYLAK